MFWKSLSQLKEEQSDPRATSPQTPGIEAIALFEDILNTGSALRVKVTGSSMSPFLEGGDVVTIRKGPPSAFQRGDLIFFKDNQGSPKLHRIIQKRHAVDGTMAFRTKGDNLIAFDRPVPDHNILGKVWRIEKNDSADQSKCVNLESRKYRLLNYFLALMSVAKSMSLCALARLKKVSLPKGMSPVRS